ncbi:unnamed protein product [Ilex paraguariensis]|uniref:DYW domain-containing protein n=1 Tax=Ilex paraguariensis TaxID=185542 RepID=A0ABC8T2G4_9AQUA
MPSSLLQLILFIPRAPFSLISFSTYISTIKHTQFSQSPLPVIQNFLSLLQESSKNLILVRSIHAQIITNSLYTDQYLSSKLVKAYSEFGCFKAARYVFDQFSHPEVFLCNAMMKAYSRDGRYRETLEMFRMIRLCNLEIDSCTCTLALKACTSLSDHDTGMGIIRSGMECGMHNNQFFGSSMINFLVKFGHVEEASRLFDDMLNKDIVCWNSMINGYVQDGRSKEAFDLFFNLRGCGIRPSPVTIVSLTQACGRIGNLELAKSIHGCVLGLGMSNDTVVLTSLVDIYGKIGDIESAYLVFNRMPTKSLVSWNAMISGCIKNGLVYQSFNLFHRLMGSGGGFDSGTIVSLLQGCSQIADLESGKILHGCILRWGLELNLILSTALVDLYSKCGAIEQASCVFKCMENKNVITWTAMLVGLAQNGHAEGALKLFNQMQEEGVASNSVTLVSLVHCCAHLGFLKKGRSVHAHLTRCWFAFDVVNLTAVIDMYAKCGKIKSAEKVFNNGHVSKDVILWNSMITGYGINGYGHQAIYVYSRMIEQGITPNQTTFLALLAACSHSGLVEEGINLFNRMETDHNVKPAKKHYACAVDLLSRAGRLEEAEAFIRKMPFEPDTFVLEPLLNGCRTHKKIDIGLRTADRLLRSDIMNPGIYVMVANIYAEVRRWDAVDYIQGLMRKRGLKKTPGCSSIEVGNHLHIFLAGDDSHPNWAEIYQHLETLRLEMEASGYVPDTSCVLRDVDEQMKVKLLWGHSERLAMVFGLLSTPAGSVIRITKNLRVCRDCHIVTKYISQMVQREIIVRDVNRFHHFRDGKCSCGDYW